MYQNDPKRVLTPECRLSYCNLVTARAPQNGVGDPKFSVTLLIPKSNPNIKQELDAAMNAAAEVGINTKWNGVRPARIESVVHDGDGVRPSGEPFGEECRGHWVVTASSKNKPYVCGADNVNCELAPTDIYSGMYARVSINFYAYNSAGKRGVGCGLRAVMKTRDGEPLSNSVVTAAEFAGVGGVQATPRRAMLPVSTARPCPQRPFPATAAIPLAAFSRRPVTLPARSTPSPASPCKPQRWAGGYTATACPARTQRRQI